MRYRILCVGNQWRGADDGSLFRAFSRAGHIISIVDDKTFIPWEVMSFTAKAIRKLTLPVWYGEFNRHLRNQVDILSPDVVCVYKGGSVHPDSIRYIKKKRIPVFCIYPDVSMFDHGSFIPACIPLYDFVLTTKSFGLRDLKDKFGYHSAALIKHCVDPEIHRPIDILEPGRHEHGCDLSFIGSFSHKKNDVMMRLLESMQGVRIKIWGGGWHKSQYNSVNQAWQKQLILGDLYAMAISTSKINLAILSEAGRNASSGDLITSRTFHIPGAGGFMMHERTSEALEIFEEDLEIVCYSSMEELLDKVNYYLIHDSERRQIADAGHRKVMSKHTSDHRAVEIFDILSKQGIL